MKIQSEILSGLLRHSRMYISESRANSPYVVIPLSLEAFAEFLAIDSTVLTEQVLLKQEPCSQHVLI